MPVWRRERPRRQQMRFLWKCWRYPGEFDCKWNGIRSGSDTRDYGWLLPNGAKFAKQVEQLLRCYVVAIEKDVSDLVAIVNGELQV